MLVCTIGFIECMIAAKRYAHKNDYQVYPNRELLAIGACALRWRTMPTPLACRPSQLCRLVLPDLSNLCVCAAGSFARGR